MKFFTMFEWKKGEVVVCDNLLSPLKVSQEKNGKSLRLW